MDSILSKYDSSNLTSSDVSAINKAFQSAGITFGKGLADKVTSQGFDVQTMMKLDPDNPNGSQTSSSTDASTTGSTSDAATTASSGTSAAESSLFDNLIQYLQSTGSSSSGASSTSSSSADASGSTDSTSLASYLQTLASSSGTSSDKVSAMFSSLLSYLQNSSQYDQSGSASYGAGSSSSMLSSVYG